MLRMCDPPQHMNNNQTQNMRGTRFCRRLKCLQGHSLKNEKEYFYYYQVEKAIKTQCGGRGLEMFSEGTGALVGLFLSCRLWRDTIWVENSTQSKPRIVHAPTSLIYAEHKSDMHK